MKRLTWVTVLSLLVGLAAGVVYAWVISPVRYVDTSPNTLRSDFKDAFRVAIAASYSATHNLDRAKARLILLGDPDPVEALSAQAQRMLASGESFGLVQDMAGLASDLRSGIASAYPSATIEPPVLNPSPPVSSSIPAPTTDLSGVPTATFTELAPTQLVFDTPTLRATRTPVPTASQPFQLLSQDQVCNPNLTDGLMQISVLDSHRHQMPGVEISISWTGGEEKFFTGLKPEIGDGYADYVMQASVAYAIRVAGAGAMLTGLIAPACPDSSGQSYLGGLKLVFQQP